MEKFEDGRRRPKRSFFYMFIFKNLPAITSELPRCKEVDACVDDKVGERKQTKQPAEARGRRATAAVKATRRLSIHDLVLSAYAREPAVLKGTMRTGHASHHVHLGDDDNPSTQNKNRHGAKTKCRKISKKSKRKG